MDFHVDGDGDEDNTLLRSNHRGRIMYPRPDQSTATSNPKRTNYSDRVTININKYQEPNAIENGPIPNPSQLIPLTGPKFLGKPRTATYRKSANRCLCNNSMIPATTSYKHQSTNVPVHNNHIHPSMPKWSDHRFATSSPSATTIITHSPVPKPKLL